MNRDKDQSYHIPLADTLRHGAIALLFTTPLFATPSVGEKPTDFGISQDSDYFIASMDWATEPTLEASSVPDVNAVITVEELVNPVVVTSTGLQMGFASSVETISIQTPESRIVFHYSDSEFCPHPFGMNVAASEDNQLVSFENSSGTNLFYSVDLATWRPVTESTIGVGSSGTATISRSETPETKCGELSWRIYRNSVFIPFVTD